MILIIILFGNNSKIVDVNDSIYPLMLQVWINFLHSRIFLFVKTIKGEQCLKMHNTN